MDFRLDRIFRLKRLPRPEDGLRAMVERAPEAEAYADRAMERARPAITWVGQRWRRLATGLVCLITAWLTLHILFGANGWVAYRQKQTEYRKLQSEYQQLQQDNQEHAAEIKALQSDPETIEKEAREQLHYARPGEVVYVPPPPPAAPPQDAHRSARK